MRKALVLLSGGIDSTTCLAMAVDRYGKENVTALSISYGQKHIKEIECAKAVAEHYGVDHYQKDLSAVFALSECTLLSGRKNMIHQSYGEQLERMGGFGTVSTYVPFRNGLFLACAAAIAISLNVDYIYYGAHADDATGGAYPDCTPEFEKYMAEAIYEGSGKVVEMKAPLIHWNKAGVVKEGLALGAPYKLTTSCYEGREKACGTCGTCIDRKAAFELNNTVDPIEYEVD